MKRIDKFTITRVTMQGFKGFCDEASFALYPITLIRGANEAGKSTIADAIAYAFWGCDFFNTSILLSDLQNNKSDSMAVTVEIMADDGKSHVISRSRSGDTTTVSFDGIPAKGEYIQQMFGDSESFLSIFNPLYLIRAKPELQKKVLERLLPAVSHDDILAALDENTRETLKGEKILSPVDYITAQRAKINELKGKLTYTQGQRDLLAEQKAKAQEKAVSLSSALADIENKLKEYDIPEYMSAHTSAIAELRARIEVKLKEYNRVKSFTDSLAPGMSCPACFRDFDAQSLPPAKKELSERLSRIVTEGRELKKQFERLENQDKHDREAFQQKHGFLTDTDAAERDRLLKLRGEVKLELSALGKAYPAENNYDTVVASIEQQIVELGEIISAAAKFAAAENDIRYGSLPAANLGVSLYKINVTTGEVKDAFRFTYNGMHIWQLSLSAQVRAGLELSVLVKKLSGLSYPVFVDNYESICHLGSIKPEGQFIFAKVENKAVLSVTNGAHRPQTKAA